MKYNQIKKIPDDYLEKKIADFLSEDSPNGDVTSINTIPQDGTSKAIIVAREDMVVSGTVILKHFFNHSEFRILIPDGELALKGDLIAEIEANSIEILRKERIFLNLMQRMSGIATLTRSYVDMAEGKIQILDTRKTTPGLRLFEKYSVNVGGGTNHRFDLSEGVMIKDNHIAAAGSITNAVNMIRQKDDEILVEVEVDNLEQIKEAIKLNIDAFLLDNFSGEETKSIVKYIRENQLKDLFVESSGGINLNNLHEYIDTGVDAISSGALTHSVRALDIGLDFE